MTRSTIQPDALRLWKVEHTDREFLLHISASWNATESQMEDDQGTHTEWQYDTIRFVVPYQGDRDAVDTFLQQQEARLLLIGKTLWEVEHGTTLTDEERKYLEDRATQDAIQTALHPFAGAGEEIKRLRKQVKALALHVGLPVTTDFAAWDAVAVSQVQK